MSELVEFPSLPSGHPQKAVLAFIHMLRELPPDGEQFRFFRGRLKQYRLWDDQRIQGTLDFLGMARAGTMKPSALAMNIKAQKTDEKARELLAQRLWEANSLLFKAVLERLKEGVCSRDEVVKHIDSFAYRGKKPGRPQIESWLQMALGLDILKMVGIALDLGPRSETFAPLIGGLDVDEFLEDAAEEASAPAAPAGGDAAGDEDDEELEPTVAEDPDEVEPAAPVAAPAAAPAASRAAAPSARVAPLINAGGLTSPRGRGTAVAASRFAGHEVFPEEVLGETRERVEAWWQEQGRGRAGATAGDFGLDAAAWMEGAEETLYRVAVAAALVFRMDRSRDEVKEVFFALDRAGVLHDLYYGTAPEVLPDRVDPKALMLASLVARRCAEAPELAATLEKQESAARVFRVLDEALGRGLFKIELFWMMGALEELGALRFDDLAGFVALPRRLVRDTLFRLGFISTPYAHDAAGLIPAARAARQAAGAAVPADEVLMSFALAAGCAYDCANRRGCEYACRERSE